MNRAAICFLTDERELYMLVRGGIDVGHHNAAEIARRMGVSKRLVLDSREAPVTRAFAERLADATGVPFGTLYRVATRSEGTNTEGLPLFDRAAS